MRRLTFLGALAVVVLVAGLLLLRKKRDAASALAAMRRPAASGARRGAMGPRLLSVGPRTLSDQTASPLSLYGEGFGQSLRIHLGAPVNRTVPAEVVDAKHAYLRLPVPLVLQDSVTQVSVQLTVEGGQGAVPITLVHDAGFPDLVGLTVSGERVLAVSQTTDRIYAFDPASGEVSSAATGDGPVALAGFVGPDGKPQVAVAHRYEPALWLYSPDLTGEPVRVPAPAYASAIAISHDGRIAYVAEQATDSVVALALPSGKVLWRAAVDPNPGTLSLADERLLVGSFGAGTVQAIELASGKVYPSIQPDAHVQIIGGRTAPFSAYVMGGKAVRGIAWSPALHRAFVSSVGPNVGPNPARMEVSMNPGVGVVDPARGVFERHLGFGDGLDQGLALDAARGLLYVADVGLGRVRVIDAKRLVSRNAASRAELAEVAVPPLPGTPRIRTGAPRAEGVSREAPDGRGRKPAATSVAVASVGRSEAGPVASVGRSEAATSASAGRSEAAASATAGRSGAATSASAGRSEAAASAAAGRSGAAASVGRAEAATSASVGRSEAAAATALSAGQVTAVSPAGKSETGFAGPELHSGPSALALSADGRTLFSLNRFSGTIAEIDVRDPSHPSLRRQVKLVDAWTQPTRRLGQILYSADPAHTGITCEGCHLEGHGEGVFFAKTHPLRVYRSPSLRGAKDTPPYFTPASTHSLAQTSAVVGNRNRLFRLRLTPREIDALTTFTGAITLLPNPSRDERGAPPRTLPLPWGGEGDPRHGAQVFDAQGCARCHPPPLFTLDQDGATRGRYLDVGTPRALPIRPSLQDAANAAFGIPSLLGGWDVFPMLTSGTAGLTVEGDEVRVGSRWPLREVFAHAPPPHDTRGLSLTDQADLAAFLLAL